MGLLEKAHTLILNNIIIYLAMPALIFRAVFESTISLSLLKIPFLAVAIAALSMAIAYIIGRLLHLKRPTFGALLLVAAIGNTGYLGYPLTLELFGIENLVKAVFYDLSATVAFIFTVGLMVAQRYGQGNGEVNIVKEIFTFPPVVGLVLALVLKGLGVGLPMFITQTVGFLAGATIPLVMLTIGLSLEVAKARNYALAIAVVVLVKLVIAPLIALFGCKLAGMSGADLGVMVLEASMPSFLLSLVIGLRYGLDTDFLPAVIVVTTMLSMISIPIWQYLLKIMG